MKTKTRLQFAGSLTLLCSTLLAQVVTGAKSYPAGDPASSASPILISGLPAIAQHDVSSPLVSATQARPQRTSAGPPVCTGLSAHIFYHSTGTDAPKYGFFTEHRRHRYSSLWAFAALNYLYADLVGVMDKNKLLQYQTGVVNGVKISPEFLTVAAGFMQVPLANVFLPQVIRNESTLRWVQIVSGTVMTLVQAGTLFVGRPAPYYVLFSALEIGTTVYITCDALCWKTKTNLKHLEP